MARNSKELSGSDESSRWLVTELFDERFFPTFVDLPDEIGISLGFYNL